MGSPPHLCQRPQASKTLANQIQASSSRLIRYHHLWSQTDARFPACFPLRVPSLSDRHVQTPDDSSTSYPSVICARNARNPASSTGAPRPPPVFDSESTFHNRDPDVTCTPVCFTRRRAEFTLAI